MLSYLAAAFAAGCFSVFGGQSAVRVLRRRGGSPIEYATATALHRLADDVRVNAMKLEDRLMQRIIQEVEHEAAEREGLAANVRALLTAIEERGGPVGRNDLSLGLEQLHNHHQAQAEALAGSLAAVAQRASRPIPPVAPAIPRDLFPEGVQTEPLLRRSGPAFVPSGPQEAAMGAAPDPAALIAGLQAMLAGAGA